MKIKEQNCDLFCVCGSRKQFPKETLPEIAFAGKSNVGKSSLINMMLGRKSLARTSSVPGKTQTINWYRVDEKIFFVDLPGYGYAKASKTDQERWGKVIEEYLNTRATLKCVLMLVDIRHEPGGNDKMMMDWLKHYQVDTIVVATKADKVTRNQLAGQVKLIAGALDIPKEKIIPVSSLNKQGRDQLWKFILRAAEAQSQEAAEVEVKIPEE